MPLDAHRKKRELNCSLFKCEDNRKISSPKGAGGKSKATKALQSSPLFLHS
jgi:hypothetical protein